LCLSMLKDMTYWKDAPVWTPKSIGEATEDWFRYLGPVSLVPNPAANNNARSSVNLD
jgi:hypothetical protein